MDTLILRYDTWRVHLLMGVYAKSCLPVLTEHIKSNKLKLMYMLDLLRTKVIELPSEISQNVFLSLNTPQSYEQPLKHFTKEDDNADTVF